MKNSVADNIYVKGDVVYAKSNPKVKLIIRRYIDRIYYCINDHDPSSKDLAYFERELTIMPDNNIKK